MGFNVHNIDPTHVGPSKTALPKGVWKLEITESEERVEKKDGETKYLNALIRVVEPVEYEGMSFFEMITTESKDAKKKERGDRTFSQIGNAIGVLEGEYDALHHKPFIASSRIEPGTNGYPDKARLDRIYWEDGSAPAKLGPSGPPAASTAAVQRPVVVSSNPAPQAAAARPWATKR